ncbi:GNAT family N-acetyltransferase [Albibacillus kandeliae]|uniref:GNAT family N-acetyltransferase n=1 Tax=Albibacillus kandeliae TaxID=2174228 RepID=UPI000D6878A8|nr:GNAT family N-acetyltransferase [Albibacillus kandeliae]
MAITIREADPREPGARALIESGQAMIRDLFHPEVIRFLPLVALAGDDVSFYVAEAEGVPLGCAALVDKHAYGEVKSMFVTDAARGRGVGTALLDRLEERAREIGLAMLKLETGPLLEAARRLYERQGFVPCPPYGGFTAEGSSIFMEKHL